MWNFHVLARIVLDRLGRREGQENSTSSFSTRLPRPCAQRRPLSLHGFRGVRRNENEDVVTYWTYLIFWSLWIPRVLSEGLRIEE